MIKIYLRFKHKEMIKDERSKERKETIKRVTKDLTLKHQEDIKNLKSEIFRRQIDYESDIRALEIQLSSYRKEYKDCNKIKRMYKEKYNILQDMISRLQYVTLELPNRMLALTKEVRIACSDAEYEVNTNSKLLK